MNKPSDVEYDDLRMQFVNLINTSHLPVFILESMVYSVYLELKNIADKQLIANRKAYEEPDGENENEADN